MQPYVSIVCQDGGHAIALEYAKLVTESGIPLLVNFPSDEKYPVASGPEQLLGQHTAALIVILSKDVFTWTGKPSRFKIDLEVIRRLLSASSTPAQSRLFLVLTDDTSASRVKGMWLSTLQCTRDNTIAREEILASLRRLAGGEGIGIEMSSFNNAASIISAVEPGFTIERIASERVSAEKISYEIFECKHRFRSDTHYYIHLHHGITITNTARHLIANYTYIFRAKNKFILLGIEKGQTRLEERISNVSQAFECKEVQYLENIASKLVADRIGALAVGRTEMAGRKFVEPQVRRGIGEDIPPSDYSVVTDWLGGPSSGVLVLVGQGGIGKTWAMMNLRARITSRKLKFSKPISKRVIFISSTDVARGFARTSFHSEYMTLYDLYCASCVGQDEDENAHANRLSRETFYDALELGSVVVFVDGLDEIITRHRARFNASYFFSDLKGRLDGESDGKVVVSCRNIFFDQDEAKFAFPYVETLELLGFDAGRRYQFFVDGLGSMPGRLAKAVALSDQMAALPEGLYVPFVLDLIKDLLLEQADEPAEHLEFFHSEILNSSDLNDRIVGQFCHREMLKILDPVRELTVDDQVRVFCEIARQAAAQRGKVDREALEAIVSRVTGRREAKGYADHLIAHPFTSQEEFSKRGVIDFRFDFMPEYFLMLDAFVGLEAGRPIDSDDIKIFNKYCSMNSPFCVGIISRVTWDASEFHFRLLQMYEQGIQVIAADFSDEDSDLMQPESAASQFSFALVSLVAAFQTRSGPLAAANFTQALREVFGEGTKLRRIALLDGFVREEERLRLDFRGLQVEDCLFHAVDIWSCQYDSGSVFSRCRFMNCPGVRSKASGVDLATFQPDCHLDAEFERVYAEGTKKLKGTETQNLDAIRSFVSDFYKQGGFRRINRPNVERYYGSSNSVVPFNRLYRLMKKHGVIEEEDHGNYLEVRIANAAREAAEKLITQGVLGGPLRKVAVGLR